MFVLRIKSSYSVRIEENTDQKKNPYFDTFQRICINLSQKCDLLKSAVQVKEQVSEAVVLRPQIRCS